MFGKYAYTTVDMMCCCRMQYSRVCKLAGAFGDVCVRLDGNLSM